MLGHGYFGARPRLRKVVRISVWKLTFGPHLCSQGLKMKNRVYMLDVACGKGGGLAHFRRRRFTTMYSVLSRPSSLEASDRGRDGSSVVDSSNRPSKTGLGSRIFSMANHFFPLELGGLEVQAH